MGQATEFGLAAMRRAKAELLASLEESEAHRAAYQRYERFCHVVTGSEGLPKLKAMGLTAEQVWSAYHMEDWLDVKGRTSAELLSTLTRRIAINDLRAREKHEQRELEARIDALAI